MSEPRNLYIAKSMEELIRLANRSSAITTNNKTILNRVANQLYSQIDPQDHEKSFIYLTNFLFICELLSKLNNDPVYFESLFGDKIRSAKMKLKELTDKLIKRYQSLNIGDKTVALLTEKTKTPTELVSNEETISDNLRVITPRCLITYYEKMLSSFDVIVFDVRSEEHYRTSRIENIPSVNIPERCIEQGLSANSLGMMLPQASQGAWSNRSQYKIIILMDWNSNQVNYSHSKLAELRDILTWDVNATSPDNQLRVLNGGYLEFLDTFPMMCSNAQMGYTNSYGNLEELLELDNIDYPDEIDKLDVKENQSDISNEDDKTRLEYLNKLRWYTTDLKEVSDKILNALVSSIESLKSQKNPTELLNSQLTENNIAEYKIQESEITSKITECAAQLENTPALTDASDKEKEQVLTNTINENQNVCEGIVKKRKTLEELRQELLANLRITELPSPEPETKIDKKSLSIIQKRKILRPKTSRGARPPTVDRSLKPPTSFKGSGSWSCGTDIPVIRIEGVPGRVVNGETGLTNIRNTCFMNAVIQCLRHLPCIKDLFCSNNYLSLVTVRETTMIHQFAALVTELWSNNFICITPMEFHRNLCDRVPQFRENLHEDTMECLMYIVKGLVNDTAVEDVNNIYCSDAQKWWALFHNSINSVFLPMFYYQFRLSYKCQKCDYPEKIWFDSFYLVYVKAPLIYADVKEGLDAFMLEDKDKCRKCNAKVKLRKKVIQHPVVLVLQLVRYVADRDGDKKLTAPCTFPLTIVFGRGIYRLYGLTLHSGGTHSGHYTAACYNKKWTLYNDAEVSPVNIDSKLIRSKVYSLYYQLEKKTEEQSD